MKATRLIMALGVAAGVFAVPAMAAGTLLKFDGGIGVHPIAGIAGGQTGTVAGLPQFPDVLRNDVHGVLPGGRPWVIRKLKVTIKDDGSISAKGQGLVFAGSPAIGTAGAVKFVGASLFCGASDHFDSAAFPISANGDFVIGGSLSSVPAIPCATPVLLIRSATAEGVLGNWFAAGIPADED